MPQLSLQGPILSLEASDQNVTQSSAVALPGGGFAAAWTFAVFGSDTASVNGATFAADGTPTGARFMEAIDTESFTGKVLNPDITWIGEDNALIAYQREEPGAPESRDIVGNLIGSGARFDFVTGPASQTDVAIAALGVGPVAFAWTEAGDVFSQIIDGGRPVGMPEQANVFFSNAQDQPDVARLEGGGYVVVWSSFNQAGTGREVLARIFDASGTPLDTEIFINNGLRGDQQNPVVTGLAGGGFAVAYESATESGNRVQVSVFDAEGDRVGFEREVSDLPLGSAGGSPAITALAEGGFAVAYDMAPTAEGHEIAVRGFEADGTPGGPSTVILGGPDRSFEDDPQVIQLAGGDVMVTWSGDVASNGDLFAQRLTVTLPGELIEGGDTGERLTGTPRADTILGNGGNDVLIGAGGGDGMTGGAGGDTFVFRPGEATVTVSDFDKREGDRLALDDRFFGLGGPGIDPRPVSQAQARAALDAGKVIYDRDSGELWIDGDGAGRGAAPALVAVLEGGPGFTFEDVLLF